MRCLYEVLGVEKDAEEGALKKAYRLQALRWHPDKNQDNPEAEDRFKEIQNAYEVLSDPHERAWYDSHRESILRGGQRYQAGGGGFERGQRPDDEEDLFQYFSPSAYSGFGDGLNGFYGVYDSLFQRLAQQEEKAHEARSDHGGDRKGKRPPGPFPRFGLSDAGWPEVAAFYAFWSSFGTVKDFAWADQYHTASAPNRKVRRAMEAENDKARRAAKREFNEAVRELAGFLRKRDKRAIAHQVEEAKKREAKQAEEAARREVERQERLAKAAAYQEAAWMRGDAEGSEDESEDGLGDEELLVWHCPACDKHFKSEAALDNHERSKKHVQQVELLRQVLEEEEAELAAAGVAAHAAPSSGSGSEGEEEEEGSSSGGSGSGSEIGSGSSALEESSAEEEEEEEEAGAAPHGASGYSSGRSSTAGSQPRGATGKAAKAQQRWQQQQRAAAAAAAVAAEAASEETSEASEEEEEVGEDDMLARLVAAQRPQRAAGGSGRGSEEGSGSGSSSSSEGDLDESDTSDEGSGSGSGSSVASDAGAAEGEEEDEAAMLQRMLAAQQRPARGKRQAAKAKLRATAVQEVAEALGAVQLEEQGSGSDDSDWGAKPSKQRGRVGKKQQQQQQGGGAEEAPVAQQQQQQPPPQQQRQQPPQQQQRPAGGKLSAKEKRRQREAAAAAAAAGAAAATPPEDELRCGVCRAEFPTRNQLFKHIKATGHAALRR